jgi:hypothetical protein
LPKKNPPRERGVDYYFVLGVPPDATEEEIRNAWRRQLKYWHPDRANHPESLEHAKLINLAHAVLSDAAKREEYDRERSAGWSPNDAYSPPQRRRAYSEPQYRQPVTDPARVAAEIARHEFVARVSEQMERARLVIENRRKDVPGIAKWQAQTLAILTEALGEHTYCQRFGDAAAEANPEQVMVAYGVLWAVYEDALKGRLRPMSRRPR